MRSRPSAGEKSHAPCSTASAAAPHRGGRHWAQGMIRPQGLPPSGSAHAPHTGVPRADHPPPAYPAFCVAPASVDGSFVGAPLPSAAADRHLGRTVPHAPPWQRRRDPRRPLCFIGLLTNGVVGTSEDVSRFSREGPKRAQGEYTTPRRCTCTPACPGPEPRRSPTKEWADAQAVAQAPPRRDRQGWTSTAYATKGERWQTERCHEQAGNSGGQKLVPITPTRRLRSPLLAWQPRALHATRCASGCVPASPPAPEGGVHRDGFGAPPHHGADQSPSHRAL